ncbi:MAG: hypothetical protein WBZ11_09420, partial [Candidatus Sulfotelmatobacter sp.]
MSFPSNWMQMWINYPGIVRFGQSATLHWFQFSPWVDVSFTPAFIAGITAWIQASPHAMMTGEIQPPSVPALITCLYLNCPSGVETLNGVFNVFLPRLPAYPAYKGISIQRFTAIPGQRGTGKFSIGMIPRSLCDGVGMTVAEAAPIQAAADSMLTPIVADGITYTPSLVSYVDGTINPITSYVVRNTIGIIKRRGKLQHRTPFGSGPK